MITRRISTLLSALALFAALTTNAQALTVDYSGSVDLATGALATLVPLGTLVSGQISYDDAAVATGTVGPAGILGIDVSVGGFCFTTGPDNTVCGAGAVVPVNSIDAAAITFSGMTPTGGILDVTTFSPTFGISIPISFDLTDGTFLATSPLGNVGGAFAPAPAVVPVPAAVWLFGSALLGLFGARRRS